MSKYDSQLLFPCFFNQNALCNQFFVKSNSTNLAIYCTETLTFHSPKMVKNKFWNDQNLKLLFFQCTAYIVTNINHYSITIDQAYVHQDAYATVNDLHKFHEGNHISI